MLLDIDNSLHNIIMKLDIIRNKSGDNDPRGQKERLSWDCSNGYSTAQVMGRQLEFVKVRRIKTGLPQTVIPTLVVADTFMKVST